MRGGAQREPRLPARGVGSSRCPLSRHAPGPSCWPRRHRGPGFVERRAPGRRNAGRRGLVLASTAELARAPAMSFAPWSPPFGGWLHPFDWAIHKRCHRGNGGVPRRGRYEVDLQTSRCITAFRRALLGDLAARCAWRRPNHLPAFDDRQRDQAKLRQFSCAARQSGARSHRRPAWHQENNWSVSSPAPHAWPLRARPLRLSREEALRPR